MFLTKLLFKEFQSYLQGFVKGKKKHTMSSEDMQNNYSSLVEPNQSVAAAESISVSVESSDRVPIECSEPPPQEMAHAPQEMAQPPTGLITEEVPQNSEFVNTEEHSVQASRPSNRTVLHLGQSIRDDNMLHQFAERLTTYSCWPSQIPQHREDMALAGFYYTGCGDRVRCAFCSLELTGWTKDVEPFSRHKDENPRCSFIEEIRHRAKKPPTSRMNMISLINEDEVEKTLRPDWGFHWIDVERAVTKLIWCRGHCTDQITEKEILEYIFQKETDNRIYPPVQDMDGLCMVCLRDNPLIVFLPCWHVCCCQGCGEKLYSCFICNCRIKAKKALPTQES